MSRASNGSGSGSAGGLTRRGTMSAEVPSPRRDSEDRPHPPMPTMFERASNSVVRAASSVASSVASAVSSATAPVRAAVAASPFAQEVVHAATHSDDSAAATSSRVSTGSHIAHKVVSGSLPAVPDPVHVYRRSVESAQHLSAAVGHVRRGQPTLAREEAARSVLSAVDAATGTGAMPMGVGEATHVGVKLVEARLKGANKAVMGKKD